MAKTRTELDIQKEKNNRSLEDREREVKDIMYVIEREKREFVAVQKEIEMDRKELISKKEKQEVDLQTKEKELNDMRTTVNHQQAKYTSEMKTFTKKQELFELQAIETIEKRNVLKLEQEQKRKEIMEWENQAHEKNQKRLNEITLKAREASDLILTSKQDTNRLLNDKEQFDRDMNAQRNNLTVQVNTLTETETHLRNREEEVLVEQERLRVQTEALNMRERMVLDKEKHVETSTKQSWTRLKEEAKTTSEERERVLQLQHQLFLNEKEFKIKTRIFKEEKNKLKDTLKEKENIIELQFMELKEKEARMMEKENTLNNTRVQEKELHQSQLIQNGKVIEFNKTEYEQKKIEMKIEMNQQVLQAEAVCRTLATDIEVLTREKADISLRAEAVASEAMTLSTRVHEMEQKHDTQMNVYSKTAEKNIFKLKNKNILLEKELQSERNRKIKNNADLEMDLQQRNLEMNDRRKLMDSEYRERETEMRKREEEIRTSEQNNRKEFHQEQSNYRILKKKEEEELRLEKRSVEQLKNDNFVVQESLKIEQKTMETRLELEEKRKIATEKEKTVLKKHENVQISKKNILMQKETEELKMKTMQYEIMEKEFIHRTNVLEEKEKEMVSAEMKLNVLVDRNKRKENEYHLQIATLESNENIFNQKQTEHQQVSIQSEGTRMERASRNGSEHRVMESTVVDISMPPPSFNSLRSH